jgi:hypothetical protein
MTAILDVEFEDFENLDRIIAEAEERKGKQTSLAAKQTRLARLQSKHSADAELERQILIADIRRIEEGFVWTTVSRTAVFRSQRCLACGRTHTVFNGWMTEQRHKADHTARRLLAGAPVGTLPVRREEMWEDVDLCVECFHQEHKC